MPLMLVALIAVFLCVALVAGLVTSQALTRSSASARRLREMTPAGAGMGGDVVTLTESLDPRLSRLSAALPKSPKELGRLRLRLAAAGHYSTAAAVWFSVARLVLPAAIIGLSFAFFSFAEAVPLAMCFGGLAYLTPALVVRRQTKARQKAITNGLPDVLDLLIVCIEAGSALDQSIVKASEELELAHPLLARELQLISTEIRAGKSRLEAFQNFSQRTGVEEVRSLVTMLIQTDRFGTSVSQALRTHADTSRVKRRQRAEERAAKVGVKLVFPLVFCVFPAVYMVCIGPVGIQIYRAFR